MLFIRRPCSLGMAAVGRSRRMCNLRKRMQNRPNSAVRSGKKHHQSDGPCSARCSRGHGTELEPAALWQPKGSPFTGTAQLPEPSGPESGRRGVPGQASISGPLQPLKHGLRRRGSYGLVPNWCLTRFYEAPGTYDKSSFFQLVFKTDPKLLADIAEVGLTSTSLNTGCTDQ